MNANEQKSLQEVQDLLDEIKNVRKQTKKKTLLFSCVTATTILLFVFSAYSSIKSNFKPEAMQATFIKKMAEYSPNFSTQTSEMMRGVPEAFQTEFVKHMSAKMPKFYQSTLSEMDGLQQNLSQTFQKSLDQKIASVLNLKNDPNQANLMNLSLKQDAQAYLLAELKRLRADIAMRILDRFSGDIGEMFSIIKGFPREQESEINETHAKKMFMHFWLKVADQQLMK